MATKKLKVKTKSGKIVDYPFNTVKKILATAGFTGGLLIKVTNGVFKEAKKLTKAGVITTTNLEKAIFRAISNTNKLLINSAQKFTRRILK